MQSIATRAAGPDRTEAMPPVRTRGRVATSRQSIAFLTTRFDPLVTEPTRAPSDPLSFPGYQDALAAARRAGSDESLLIGTGRVGGQEAVLAIGAFECLGGSMGAAHGERFVRAVDCAIDRRLPLVVVTASGGARLQEGTLALDQMARTTAAVARLRAAGIPLVVFARSPTTGGVHVSYGALGDVTIAEEGSLLAFAGPRVRETALGRPAAPSLTADEYGDAGFLDAVVPIERAQQEIATWLDLLGPARRDGALPAATPVSPPRHPGFDGGEALRRARSPLRPSVDDYLAIFTTVAEVRGDHVSADDPSVRAGFGKLGDRSVAFVATDVAAHPLGHITASGFRKATRLVRTASRLGVPVVTLVDTRGADPTVEAEREGLGYAVADTFVAFAEAPVPSVAVVVGEAASGAGMALAACDRVLIQEDAVFPVIDPASAAAILRIDGRDVDRLAGQLGITAHELLALGLVDRVLPGPTVEGTLAAVGAERSALIDALADMTDQRRET